MDTAAFLRAILPAQGLYVVARLTGKGFRHQVCDTIEEAAAYALQFDSQGVPTYHACAAYRERDVATVKPDGSTWHQVRIHKNVRAIKSFWMDIDCKPGVEGAYPDQDAALDGLLLFVNATKLPMPMVVSSGNGIHLYWILDEEILPETWKSTAAGLKALAAKVGFKADPACTSDPARILRPVGTFNRKDASAPRAVELIAAAAPNRFVDFNGAVGLALSAMDLRPARPTVRQVASNPVERINQSFEVKPDFPPCSGLKVADRCQQLAKIRDTRGNVPEPLWYAGIQLLCHAVEGDELIHHWSQGYAGYSDTETGKKIAQVRSQGVGPTLCSTFEERAPGGCAGCPFKGKISTPAQLGTEVKSAPAPEISLQVEDKTIKILLPEPPPPFVRGEKGGIYTEIEGITHQIYEYDFYPTELAYDEQLGFETVRFRHYLPRDGWKECVLESALLARPVDFESKLRGQHIQPLIRNQMAAYADAYMRKLRTTSDLRQLFKCQGWKSDDTEFVLGNKLYKKDEIVHAGFSNGAKTFLEQFTPKGELAPWRDLTCIFTAPELAPHAFTLLLAFAAPLLKLCGREGFLAAALGVSNAGKTTMAKFMASVYGHPKKTWVGKDATLNARFERIGAYHSIPVYIDEITTISPKDLRELAYSITLGKHRESLKQDRTVRAGAEWATIVLASTNNSLQAKLLLENQNAEAESLRLFEYGFPQVPLFQTLFNDVHNTVDENYGVAGPTYIRNLVHHRDEIREEARRLLENACEIYGFASRERYWAQAVALTLYGGRLAREWGIIDFDPEVVKPWLLAECRRMRTTLTDSLMTAVGVLCQFLDEHIGERLVITQINASMGAAHQRPSRELSIRYEKDTETIYISRKRLSDYLAAKHFNCNDIKDELLARGVIQSANIKKTLGSGTDFKGGSIPCWKIKADHPELTALLGTD